MTNDAVVFDATACWEIAHETAIGLKLDRKYLRKGRAIHVSALVLGEIAAKAQMRIDDVLDAVKGVAIIVPVTAEIAEQGGRLRPILRKHDPSASLADAIHLTTARVLGATLVSNDKAFTSEPDVEWP